MSTPRINPADPKWTAYVLGELGAAERAEIERLLETSHEARALVEELEMATTALKDELTPQMPLLLTPEQRAAVRTAADRQAPRSLGAFLAPRWAWGLGAAAAILVVVLAALPMFLRSQSQPQVAQIDVVATPPSPFAPNAGPAAAPESEQASKRANNAPTESAVGQRQAAAPTATAPTAQPSIPEAATQVGSVAETVTVSGETPVVELQSSARQRVLSKDEISAVPSGRVFQPLGVLVPGAGGAVASASGRGGAVGNPMALGSPVVGTRFDPPDTNRIPPPQRGTEAYDRIVDNPFIRVSQEPLATFSIDVDTASYSNVRRFLNQNQLPPKDAVRIEELINYFGYNYAQPSGQHPIAPNMEVAAAPWNPQHRLVRIGIKAREINANRRPPSNLVFLIDVSGSMNAPDKLPLVRNGLQLLVNQLGENDFVSMVVYAGTTGLVLPPTSGQRKDVIFRAIDNLEGGGSTNGGAGIQLAYNQARANFIRGGVNRVILMTDGDFNVGITNQGDLTRLIEDRAKSGVFLSVLGFGTGNLKDSTMEKLADMGNGHYAYIDTINEARKVLVDEMGGTLVTVAKDVKIQVDFNPGKVEAYRLIGYENRVLRAEDFNNDLKDAGDMGAGHTVTALFEVVPRGGSVPGPSIDPSVFQPRPQAEAPRPPASTANEMLVLRVRYKLPDASESTRMDVPLTDRGTGFAGASSDFRFATSVAAFGMILRESPYAGTATFSWVMDTAAGSRGQDRSGYRDEFISLVQKANALRTLR